MAWTWSSAKARILQGAWSGVEGGAPLPPKPRRVDGGRVGGDVELLESVEHGASLLLTSLAGIAPVGGADRRRTTSLVGRQP
jgi:hypothetical protein